MTAQIPDWVSFDGNEYVIVGLRGGDLISPEQFGLKPTGISSACWRGFHAGYEIVKAMLYLRELTISQIDRRYPVIGGTEPEIDEYQAMYHGLNVLVPFTGKIRLAKDFVPELYIHMGFPKPTAFKTVLDVSFLEGEVINVRDRSNEMGQKRGTFKRHYEASGLGPQRIEEAFSLDMDLE